MKSDDTNQTLRQCVNELTRLVNSLTMMKHMTPLTPWVTYEYNRAKEFLLRLEEKYESHTIIRVKAYEEDDIRVYHVKESVEEIAKKINELLD